MGCFTAECQAGASAGAQGQGLADVPGADSGTLHIFGS